VHESPAKLSGRKKATQYDSNELNLTWLNSHGCPTLLSMQKRIVQRGRPPGTTTFEAEPAQAFGEAVRAARKAQGISQEELAALAGIERSHMGKIERGQHMATLALILKIAVALRISSAELMTATEDNLGSGNGS